MDLGTFHFLRPAWLLALLPLALLAWRAWHRPVAAPAWARACDPELLQALVGERPPVSRLPRLLMCAVAVVAVLALAGPSWQRLPSPVFETTESRVLVLDLSASMNADDIRPSRLARARYAATDLLRGLPEGRFALVAFAGSAFAVAPLTTDRETVRHLLDSLTPELMPVPGGRIGEGLAAAHELLRNGAAVDGEVILLTDSTPDAAALAQAEALALGAANSDEPHRHFPGNRPSVLISWDKTTPYALGRLLALYEHITVISGFIWDVNSFDQWGVELGKQLGGPIDTAMSLGKNSSSETDAATEQWINNYFSANSR